MRLAAASWQSKNCSAVFSRQTVNFDTDVLRGGSAVLELAVLVLCCAVLCCPVISQLWTHGSLRSIWVLTSGEGRCCGVLCFHNSIQWVSEVKWLIGPVAMT